MSEPAAICPHHLPSAFGHFLTELSKHIFASHINFNRLNLLPLWLTGSIGFVPTIIATATVGSYVVPRTIRPPEVTFQRGIDTHR